MCYRDEKQELYNEKLDKEFFVRDENGKVIEELVPKFIRDFFGSKPKLKSSQSRVSYWRTYKQFFNYLISQGILESEKIINIQKESIKTVKVTNINQFLIYCRNVGKNSEDTIFRKYNELRSLFSYFLDDEIIDRNIMNKVSMDKPKQKPIKYATVEDRNKVIANLNNMKNEYDKIRNQAIVYLLFGSGVRISELIGLDMTDLHLSSDKPYIHVYRKGGDTDNVAISTEAKIALEDYLFIREERVDDNNKNIVFISERTTDAGGSKRRMTEKAVNKLLETYSKGTITPHMFRKGLGMLIGNDVNGGFSAVAQQLGNSATTVQRYYSKIDDNTIYNILDK